MSDDVDPAGPAAMGSATCGTLKNLPSIKADQRTDGFEVV